MNTALWTIGMAALTLASAGALLLGHSRPNGLLSFGSGALGTLALMAGAALGLVELILFGIRAMR